MNDVVDMSQFVEAKSDQLTADDLIGTSRTITVTRVTGNDGDQPISIHYEGDNGKPFRPCKTIRRVLMGVWGRYANEYVGKSMTLYRDDKVTFGGLEVGGIRISHMSHIDKETVVVVMKSKGKKAGMKILPLRQERQQQSNSKQTAEDFARAHIDAVKDAPDVATIEEIQKADAKGLARLKEAKPALFADCELAANTRRAALEREGKSDSDFGDGFSDAQPPYAATVANIRQMIANAMGPASLEAAAAELDKHVDALPENIAEELTVALADRRNDLA